MIRRLSLLWKRFTPLEERLLAEIGNALPADGRAIFDAQVAAVTHVQRLPPSWSEIDFYPGRGRARTWSGVPMFPCTDEFRLAEVRFLVAQQSYKATLSSIGGHIFDFAITPGPKPIAFAPWAGEPRTQLLADPMRPASGTREPEPLPRQWREFLARRPAPPSGWVLHDETTAYRVALDDGQYVILAEREGDEFILFRVEPPDARLFHLEHHDGVPTPVERELDALV